MNMEQKNGRAGYQEILGDRHFWVFVVALSLVAVAVPSTRSLWTDEGYSALNAFPGSFGAWLMAFAKDLDLDPLKPFHGFTVWLFSLVTGHGEQALRLHNLAWFVPGALAMFYVGRRYRAPVLPWVWILHPFVWYYLDEVRPYAMQLGAGAVLLASMSGILDTEGKKAGWIVLFLASSFVLTGSSLLGFFPVAAVFGVLLLVGFLRGWRPSLVSWLGIGLWLLLQAGWLGYYLCKMIMLGGEGGSKQWDVGIQNLVFSVYEFMGMSGLGPEREELRDVIKQAGMGAGLRLFLNPVSLLLPLAAALWAFLGAASVWESFRKRDWISGGMWTGALAVLLLSVMGLLVGAFLFGWPFWGRHLAGVLPFFVFVVLLPALSGGRFCRGAGLVLLVVLIVSSCRWKFSQNEQREDYRSASVLARDMASEGGTVWWVAASQPGRCYGVVFDGVHVLDPLQIGKELAQEPAKRPDLVLVNRADATDPDMKIREWLGQNGYVATRDIHKFETFRPACCNMQEPQ